MPFPLFTDSAKPRFAIGLMSGTSADGIDAALVQIKGCGTETSVSLRAFITLPFTDEVRARILRVVAGDFGGSEELCRMNAFLGELSADACVAVCKKAKVPLCEIAFVGSHGQTVFHAPDAAEYLGKTIRSTFQIGEASAITERIGCPVVSDFRVRDMAAGGLGAPLVPYTSIFYSAMQSAMWRCKISAASAISRFCPKAAALTRCLRLTQARAIW